MAAVDINKLNEQCRLVSEQFGSPHSLVISLRLLFESYADRTYEISGIKQPSLKIPEYHLPPLVLRQLELILGKFCEENPLTTLELVDLLWGDPMMEPRQLAAGLLGKIPPDYFTEVTNRLIHWTAEEKDFRLTEYLASKGSVRIRNEAPEQWITILGEWMQSGELLKQNLALQSLLPLIHDRRFINLPEIFTLLTPHLRKVESKNIPTLQAVISALIERSPNEMVYFLKQIASSSTNPNLFRLLRRCLPLFPEDLRNSLRETVKNNQPE